MKILITAFEPFGGEKVNPALEAMKLLPDKIGEAQILKLELPTVFKKSIEKVWQHIDEYEPDIVISLGQAGGRACISTSHKKHGRGYKKSRDSCQYIKYGRNLCVQSCHVWNSL